MSYYIVSFILICRGMKPWDVNVPSKWYFKKCPFFLTANICNWQPICFRLPKGNFEKGWTWSTELDSVKLQLSWLLGERCFKEKKPTACTRRVASLWTTWRLYMPDVECRKKIINPFYLFLYYSHLNLRVNWLKSKKLLKNRSCLWYSFFVAKRCTQRWPVIELFHFLLLNTTLFLSLYLTQHFACAFTCFPLYSDPSLKVTKAKLAPCIISKALS